MSKGNKDTPKTDKTKPVLNLKEKRKAKAAKSKIKKANRGTDL
ncbi:hypothetical protein [Leeuwenhoekiella sp. MAR_2009_132]|nr:hypothetical protein [Leeuwenhoekiella sp. MAR_2009_132]